MSAEIPERTARHAASAAAAAADRAGRPQWAAVRVRAACRDALSIFSAADDANRFYWERPDAARSLATRGASHVVEAAGPDRFARAARAAREILAAVHLAGDSGPPRSGALLVGGFAFSAVPSTSPDWSGFPPCRFSLPEVLHYREGDRAWCTAVRRIDPGADAGAEALALAATAREAGTPAPHQLSAAGEPGGRASHPPSTHPPSWAARADRSPDAYRALVATAIRDIAAGELEKVVLARSVELRHGDPLDVIDLLRKLRDTHPSCTQFAVMRGDAVFLGATPERLVQLEDGRVATAAVAGSAPRGRDPEDDTRLGRELCESKKEQAEHAVVVRALCDALSDVCVDLRAPEAPQLLRLGDIQHLATPVTGRLRNGTSVLDLVGRLHPTPAVGGAPQAAALAWIERREDLDRGWYAGPVGFVDSAGGGDFNVALRSALVRGARARLYAGAGIVSGSLPGAELRETRLKLRAVMAPLLDI